MRSEPLPGRMTAGGGRTRSSGEFKPVFSPCASLARPNLAVVVIREKKMLSAEDWVIAVLSLSCNRGEAQRRLLESAVHFLSIRRSLIAAAAATVRLRAIGVGKMDGHAQTTGPLVLLRPFVLL